MPLCYNYDTDTNWFGGSMTNGAVSATTTTADGSQNESRYIRVELPANNNLMSFAGVVASGGWVGKSDARALDIYVPNGAIVPVRCDIDTTKGVTVLAITVASQELGDLVYGTSRPVAIAAEDETGLDDAAGITLATLDPNRFIYQDLDGTALSIGTGTSNRIANIINLTCAQTSGWCIGFSNTLTTVTTSNHSGTYLGLTNTGTGAGGFHVLQVRGSASGTAIAADVNGVYTQVDLEASSALSSGKATGIFSKVHVKASGGTHAGDVVAGRFELGLDTAVTGDTAMFYFAHQTNVAETPDYLFKADYASTIGGLSSNSDTVDYGIPIRIAGTTYYLAVTSALS